MTAEQIATIALEFWRASGARTPERLAALVTSTVESYYGSGARWSPEVAAVREAAATAAGRQVRPWEA